MSYFGQIGFLAKKMRWATEIFWFLINLKWSFKIIISHTYHLFVRECKNKKIIGMKKSYLDYVKQVPTAHCVPLLGNWLRSLISRTLSGELWKRWRLAKNNKTWLDASCGVCVNEQVLVFSIIGLPRDSCFLLLIIMPPSCNRRRHQGRQPAKW